MIISDILPQFLQSLGFSKNKSTYTKTFGAALLAVDIAKHTISYPEKEGLLSTNGRPAIFRQMKTLLSLSASTGSWKKAISLNISNWSLNGNWGMAQVAAGPIF